MPCLQVEQVQNGQIQRAHLQRQGSINVHLPLWAERKYRMKKLTSEEQVASDSLIAPFLAALGKETSISEAARQMGCARRIVSQWVCGDRNLVSRHHAAVKALIANPPKPAPATVKAPRTWERKDNKSGAVGVELRKSGKWLASAMVEGGRHHIGYFPTKEAAMDARQSFLSSWSVE